MFSVGCSFRQIFKDEETVSYFQSAYENYTYELLHKANVVITIKPLSNVVDNKVNIEIQGLDGCRIASRNPDEKKGYFDIIVNEKRINHNDVKIENEIKVHLRVTMRAIKYEDLVRDDLYPEIRVREMHKLMKVIVSDSSSNPQEFTIQMNRYEYEADWSVIS